MKSVFGRVRRIAAVVAMALAIPAGQAQTFSWTTIVNNGDAVPGTEATFNSYNQPSINSAGQVVFRARGRVLTGGEVTTTLDAAAEAMVVSGVFKRDMSVMGSITTLIKRGDPVPQPNNTLYNGVLASYTEFPSMPRIDYDSPLVATRGQSLPVYTYLAADGITETRVGTSGIYADAGSGILTGSSLLGAVMEVQPGGAYALTFPYYSVPGAPAGTRFDQFPGGPAVTNGSIIAFKGNYTDPTDGLGRTGVYYRDIVAEGGLSPVKLVANSNMLVPNQPPGGTTKFESTSPPSAANGFMAFLGLDIEDAPTMGGIYRAQLLPEPPLQVLAGIGDQVPGEPAGARFNRLGEGLSMSSDGRFVSFWGAWGTATTTKVLYCPADGNVDLLAFCNANYPAGYTAYIPVNQGIFVADAQTGAIIPVAKTGHEGMSDFVYWVFSGRPPGVGGVEDGSVETTEPPRWRSSAFAALSGSPGNTVQVAYKGKRNGVDGIYLRKGNGKSQLFTVVETFNTPGQGIDPGAPANSIVTALGVERDGFRGNRLAVAVSMLYETVDTSIGWAGLYIANVQPLNEEEVKLSVSPASINFGDVQLGLSSSPMLVTVSNNGTLAAALSPPTVSGDFAISATSCGETLAASTSCSIAVVFAPTVLGPRLGQLDVNGPALSVLLEGNAIASGSLDANVTAVIIGYYESLMHRSPEPAGLASWQGEATRVVTLGADIKEVFYAMARAFLNSPEYRARNTSNTQFVSDLYAAFFHRAPDASELAFWETQLTTWMPRHSVMTAFLLSPEYAAYMKSLFGPKAAARAEVHAVTDFYRGLLDRLPETDPGFIYWVGQWRIAQCTGAAAVAEQADVISLGFLLSDEYSARIAALPANERAARYVSDLYDAFMRRAGEEAGFVHWVTQIESGAMTHDQVRQAFMASPEFQSRITAIIELGCML